MNIYKKIEKEIRHLIENLKQEGKLPADVSTDKVEATPSKDPSHGDIATNAAMVIAAQISAKPRDIAELILEKLSHEMVIAKSEIAGPGFINITLNPSMWQKAILDILEHGRGYGTSTVGNGCKVNVEYVSANPTGPMHVGHGRGAVYGDALATLLQKAGYDVTREYYINDAGAQIDKLADSAYLRYREACGEVIGDIPEGLYPGDYLVPVGKTLAEKYGKKFIGVDASEYRPVIRLFTVDAMMDMIRDDLAVLGIRHDVFSSERAITEAGKVDEAIASLESKGLIYRGVLEPPKGKAPEDWEPKEQTLFKASQFGDDSDRPVKKSDGAWTYFAPDIAYHFDKCKRGFHKLIDVFGADHGGYVKRLKAVVHALSDNKVELDVKLCQMVKFLRNGEPAKMSKRAGTFVTVREVVDEVGKDVFRFIMLTRKNDVPLDFDFAKVMEQSKDNPVFYVQYAHARTRSVIRNATAELPEAAKMAEKPSFDVLHRLSHTEELAMIRLLCGWPRLVESAAAAREPHRVAFFLHDLAAAFHGFWNLGNDDLELRFIVKHDIQLTAARIALANAISQVIASGLNVLGVEPVEEMR
jgi:arginyl-tRNA synthetase